MIREIHIRNFALIEELTIEFDAGFSVFTGETGAGKSILIGAISLLLGERASLESIRSGAEEAEVTGVLDVRGMSPGLRALLEEFAIAPADDDTLIIRRKIARNDRNKILVNQIPLPLASLRKIGDLLVDLHGQHEHQSLLDEETHVTVIDALPKVRDARSAYDAAYREFSSVKSAAEAFAAKAAALAERKEVLEFHYKEIAGLDLLPGEEEELQSELHLLSSSAERRAAASAIMELLTASQESLEKQTAQVKRKLDTLAKFDASVQPWVADVENALAVFTELETFCGSYLSRIGGVSSEARIEALNQRLSKIQRLKKKHACTLEQLIEKRDALKADLASIVNSDADKAELDKKLAAALASCMKAGAGLGAVRKKGALDFDTKITAHMELLGFSGGRWQTKLAPREEPGPGGLETVCFMVQTNRGEPMMPLVNTASGGEISRLMLAIKNVMADHDRIPVLIFDEIDTGIGGMLAGNVAKALRDLSASHQVLCISHLHQIASRADRHYHVYKEEIGGRTVTRVNLLAEAERVDEVARMLGGDSAVAKQHAKELLKKRLF